MNSNKSTSDRIVDILAVLSCIGCIISYFFIDGTIGIHWNSQWQIDHYVEKEYLFLIGAAPIIMLLIYDFVVLKDPKHSNLNKNVKTSKIIRHVLVMLMIVVSWMSVSTGFSREINYKMIVPILIGISFMLVGNYMPTVSRNYVIGVRTTWTMLDETCWRKTNRFGGYIFAVYGLFLVIAGIWQSEILNIISVWFLILGVIVTMFYSYFIYRKIKRHKNQTYEDKDE